jgi:hypothetical protein
MTLNRYTIKIYSIKIIISYINIDTFFYINLVKIKTIWLVPMLKLHSFQDERSTIQFVQEFRFFFCDIVAIFWLLQYEKNP